MMTSVALIVWGMLATFGAGFTFDGFAANKKGAPSGAPFDFVAAKFAENPATHYSE
jgi:hypothetical protein